MQTNDVGSAAPISDPTIEVAAPLAGAIARPAQSPNENMCRADARAVTVLVRRNDLFRVESVEAHLEAARDAEVLRIAPPWSRVVFWLSTTFVVAAVALACTFDVEQTGFARGVLRAGRGAQALATLTGGTVIEVATRSGEVVSSDSLLVRIDSAPFKASLLEAERQVALAEQKLASFAKRRVRVHAQRMRLLEQNAALLARRGEKQGETVRRSRAKQQTFRALVKEGLTSELQKNDVEDELASAERDAFRLREEHTRTKLQIADITAELDMEATKLEADLQQAKDRHDAINIQLAQTEIRAPRSGRVEAMLVKVGDAIGSGASIGRLVPTDSPRQVVVFVPERDRAFLREGAVGRIEFDQLPAGEFGTVPVRVSRIASDLASPSEIADAFGDAKLDGPVYRVECSLEPSANLDRLEKLLRPGSLATGRFALRKRRIITVLFEPLRRFFA